MVVAKFATTKKNVRFILVIKLVGAKFASTTKNEFLPCAFFALPKKNADSFQNGNSSKKIKLFGFPNNYFEKKTPWSK